MIHIELLQPPVCLSRFQTDWERLFKAGPHEPSTSFEWTEALREHHLNGNDEFVLLVGRQDQRVCALVPLVRERLSLSGLPLTSLRVISERSNTHSDLLCEKLDESMMEALLEGFRTEARPWDVMRFTRVLEGSALDCALTGALQRSGVSARFRLEPPSFFLPLPDTFDRYLRTRSGKFRNYLRRMEKGLQTGGQVRFIKISAPEVFSQAYEDLLNVEKASWKHGHGTAISTVSHQMGFYYDMAKGALNAGRLHLTFLKLDHLPVAYNLGLLTHGRYHYLKTSFHEAYRRLGVATISRARLIRMLIDEGIREFDFPGEPYEWEAQWTEELRWHRSVVVYNKTVMGRLYRTLTGISDKLRRIPPEHTVAYCDPKALRAPGERTP